jgi:predicted CXXCH cytochrome family protein
MKKSAILVLAMSFVIVFATVGTAYAVATSDYATWVDGSGTDTPHKSYGLTTVKCAVCHAVHKAPAGGQLLMRDSVGNACTYCHITTATGVKVIYGGTTQNYYSTADLTTAHSNSGTNPVACTECHAVHGASTLGGAATAKILKSGSYQPRITDHYSANSATRNEQISVFCTRCHPYYVDGYDQTVAGSVGQTVGTWKSHIMTSTVTAYGNTQGNYPGKVTWAGSQYCRSCHDAGLIDGAAGYETNSFPHYTAGASRFLLGAVSSVAVPSAAANANYDGVCLKCHTNGTNGVGVDF